MRFTAGSLLSSFHSSLLMGIHTPKREEKWLNWAQKGAAGSSDPTSSELPGLVEKLLGAGSGCWVLGAGCWAGQLEGSAPSEPLSPLSRASVLLIPF